MDNSVQTSLPTGVFEQVYGDMVAGRVPNHEGDVTRSIYYLARENLHTERLHLLTSFSEDGRFAYYFAAPSVNFTSAPGFLTPLAAAFPTHPDHKGDGVYLLSQGSLAVAVEKNGERFRMLFNHAEAMQGVIEDLELPVYDVDEAQPMLMEAMASRYRFFADDLSRKTIKVAAVVALASSLIGVGAMVTDSVLATRLDESSQKATDEINALMTKIEHVSPLSAQLAALQKVSSTVVRAGGWIDEYEMVGDKEKFVVSLPEWVTSDYISALGSSAVADKDPVNNVIKVVKK